MANLTITVDEELLKRARIRALQQGTSVNAVLAERLKEYANEGDEKERAWERLSELVERNDREGGIERAKLRRGEKRWSREELYERR